jgi:hypothetical protein
MKDEEPLVRIKTEDGETYYPKFEKNTRGKWTPKDKSLQETLRHRARSEKPGLCDK